MAIMKMLGIGIPSYNRPDDLLALVKSIENLTEAPYRLWIVDDFSSQKTQFVLSLLENKGHATVIRKDHRKYAGFDTFNRLLDIAQEYRDECPYFVKIDDDCELVITGWDRLVIEALDNDPKVGIVTCAQCNVGFPISPEGYIRQCKAEFMAFRSSALSTTGRYIIETPEGDPLAYSMDSEYAERFGYYGYKIKQIQDLYRTVAAGTGRRPEYFKGEKARLDREVKRACDFWGGIEDARLPFMNEEKVRAGEA